MTEFLIKSTVAMGVLLGLYYILFEKEKMHRFNRFYLIGALIFSLVLPFITIITYIKQIPHSNPVPIITSLPSTIQAVQEEPIDYPFYIGWGIYTIVTLLLTIRFAKNFLSFYRKATSNPSVLMGNAKLILLEEKILPHTFLYYIFVNREEHETKRIEEELYTHEYTHVRQKHTLDILFIEALKVLFWFNPLLYFYKKAIQLNHEFLADEKVIDTTANTVYYQNLLLEKAIVGTTFPMASNLTFSLTKKRFLMMTKTTSTTKAGLLKLAMAPVIAGLMVLFCTKTIAQETKPKTDAERIKEMIVPDKVMDSLKKVNPDTFSDDPEIRFRNTEFKFIDKNGKVTAIKKGYKNLSEEQKKKVGTPEIYGMGSMEIQETSGNTTSAIKAPTAPKHANKKTSNVVPEKPAEKDYTLNLSGAIHQDPHKIKAIEIDALTDLEKNALKELDPDKYNDETLKNIIAFKTTYINDKGELISETTYQKKPN